MVKHCFYTALTEVRFLYSLNPGLFVIIPTFPFHTFFYHHLLLPVWEEIGKGNDGTHRIDGQSLMMIANMWYEIETC